MILNFVKRDILIEKHYRFHFLTKITLIFFQLTIFYFFSKIIATDYFPFLFLGIIFSRVFTFALTSFTESIRQEQFWGTLEPLFLAENKPIKLALFLLSSKFIFFLIELFLYFLIGFFIFNLDIIWTKFFYVFLILIFNLITFIGLGFLSAGFVLMFKRGDPVNWFTTSIVELISGVYFPVSVFPDWLKNISNLFPTTYGLNLLRDIVLKGTYQPVNFFILIFSLMIITITGYLFFKYSVNISKKRGTLGYY